MEDGGRRRGADQGLGLTCCAVGKSFERFDNHTMKDVGKSRDIKVAIGLLVFSPLWLPAAAATAVWYAAWALLSRLNLPTPISGCAALLLMIVGWPFLVIAQAAALQLHFLLRERLHVDGSQVTVTTWRGTRHHPWSTIQSVTREWDPPAGGYYRLQLIDGAALTLSAFANTDSLVTQARSLGHVIVDKTPWSKPGSKTAEEA